MIILFEGIEKVGKTTIINTLKNYLNNIDYSCQSFDNWNKSRPDFRYTNPFVDKMFEDVSIADFLFAVKLDTILLLDRSLISGFVYANWRMRNGLYADITYDKRYLEFWLKCLANGVNKPFFVVYIKVDNIYGVSSRNDSQNQVIKCNTIIDYNDFFNENMELFKKFDVEFYELYNNNDIARIDEIVKYLADEIIKKVDDGNKVLT